MFKLGLVINPYAGIGGALALKGSDGKAIREQALAKGAEKKANLKTRLALEVLLPIKEQITIYTASGEMGEDIARSLGFTVDVVYHLSHMQSEASDTESAVACIVDKHPDLLMFAGGDGTARNILSVVAHQLPVIGVPAGCKIHSGVYAVTPASAGRVALMLAQGDIVSVGEGEVKDLDEDLFRQGKVSAKWYGQMQVPTELTYVQGVKMGGKESDELVLDDLAAHVIEMMEEAPERAFIMGSGSTVDAVMQELGLPNTLLGIDVVKHHQLVLSDATADELERLSNSEPCTLVMTLIGGQGHILGRGNQQLSPQVIRHIKRENILLLASKSKLMDLKGKPLISDSGDPELDLALSGLMSVVTGYKDHVLYPVAKL